MIEPDKYLQLCPSSPHGPLAATPICSSLPTPFDHLFITKALTLLSSSIYHTILTFFIIEHRIVFRWQSYSYFSSKVKNICPRDRNTYQQKEIHMIFAVVYVTWRWAKIILLLKRLGNVHTKLWFYSSLGKRLHSSACSLPFSEQSVPPPAFPPPSPPMLHHIPRNHHKNHVVKASY